MIALEEAKKGAVFWSRNHRPYDAAKINVSVTQVTIRGRVGASRVAVHNDELAWNNGVRSFDELFHSQEEALVGLGIKLREECEVLDTKLRHKQDACAQVSQELASLREARS